MFQKWMGRVYGWQDTGAVPKKKKKTNKQTKEEIDKQTKRGMPLFVNRIIYSKIYKIA